MKKFFLLIVTIVITLSICLAGCAETITGGTGGTSGSNPSQNTGGTPSDGSHDDVPEDAYTVTLALPDGVAEMPSLTGVQAKWTNANKTSVYTADFDGSGFAYCTGLDGEYSVTLTGVISGYSYNPNAYQATGLTDKGDGRHVTIQLYALQTFSGNKLGYSSNDGSRAVLKTAGAYRIQFTSSTQSFYFDFDCPTGYIYSVETYADVTENEVNPTISVLYKSTRNVYEVIPDGSDAYGSYTKNVKFQITSAAATNGASGWIYMVSIETIDGTYPRYLDIFINQEKVYSDDEFWGGYMYNEIQLEDYDKDWWQNLCDGEEPSGTFTYITDLVKQSKDFSGFEIAERTYQQGTYYEVLYNGTWYKLFAEMSKSHLGVYTTVNGIDYYYHNLSSSDYRYYLTQSGNTYKSVLEEYVKTSQEITLPSGKVTIHIVTEQLKAFLYDYSAMKLFNDGNGWLEEAGYTTSDANQWLYACGIYL